jgi:hypothetical protein
MAFRFLSIRPDLEEDAYLFGFFSGAGKVWMESRLQSGLLPYMAIIDPAGQSPLITSSLLLEFNTASFLFGLGFTHNNNTETE